MRLFERFSAFFAVSYASNRILGLVRAIAREYVKHKPMICSLLVRIPAPVHARSRYQRRLEAKRGRLKVWNWSHMSLAYVVAPFQVAGERAQSFFPGMNCGERAS